MRIVKQALAGTLESSDLLVRVAPAEGEFSLMIHSEVQKQFGDQIRRVAEQTLAQLGVKEGIFILEDKGALDCVIRARLQSAVLRAADAEQIDWGKLQ
ncbi:citrate lyase acyl carrier protein [Cedecea neteri]|uniref:citrate lyase acyl carrier protein n=1 Tax=Cedecea neteri TaxID=158822 RepID=UPI00155F3B7C|nr:citrate lyase acyl carrier protein [Cedecea neteri]NIG77050.1 citrate lyase acyl carrier protein [Klebsiella sp. Ap-873]WNJ78978.1 citrate lyase acyl carrier protein [Cedecea neteri]